MQILYHHQQQVSRAQVAASLWGVEAGRWCRSADPPKVQRFIGELFDFNNLRKGIKTFDKGILDGLAKTLCKGQKALRVERLLSKYQHAITKKGRMYRRKQGIVHV